MYAGDFSITVRDGNPYVKRRIEQEVESEDSGVNIGTYALASFTAGLSLAAELPLRSKWHRDKLLRLHDSPAIFLIDLMASGNCDIHSMLHCLNPLLRKRDLANNIAKVIEFDFARAAALARDISETDYYKILAIGKFLAASIQQDGPVAEKVFSDKIAD